MIFGNISGIIFVCIVLAEFTSMVGKLHMKKVLFGLIFIPLAIVASSKDIRTILPVEPLAFVNTPFDNLHTPWVDSVFNSLTPDQRIGQLFFAAA